MTTSLLPWHLQCDATSNIATIRDNQGNIVGMFGQASNAEFVLSLVNRKSCEDCEEKDEVIVELEEDLAKLSGEISQLEAEIERLEQKLNTQHGQQHIHSQGSDNTRQDSIPTP